MRFKDDFYFLSNMYSCPVRYVINGTEYSFKCSESVYQAMKCPERAEEFVPLNGYEAKRLGRTVEVRPDWDEVKLGIMKEIVKAKFDQNAMLQNSLVSVDREIVEENTWYDIYWGVCKGVGENHLGKILMDLREQYCPFRCMVVGSRGFADYSLMCRVLDRLLMNHKYIEVVSGGAKGADALAERYASEYGYSLTVMEADWGRYGMSAGYKRNRKMHEYISKNRSNCGIVAFWDGESKGTAHNFEMAVEYEIPIKIYNYKEGRFIPNPADKKEKGRNNQNIAAM